MEKLFSGFLILVLFTTGLCDPPLTNKHIIEMLEAGLTAEIVTAKIKTSVCEFDTSPDSLKALKEASVPDSVILAMVEKGASIPESASETGWLVSELIR